jgi:hypothetical protein
MGCIEWCHVAMVLTSTRLLFCYFVSVKGVIESRREKEEEEEEEEKKDEW